MEEGRPLDETTRNQMESLIGHDLREVRLHDSRQAGEIARRLGGEAFTLGKHVFGQPEKLSTLTGEGTGILAHEITHVLQQTGPRELPGNSRERHLPIAPLTQRGGTIQRKQQEIQAQTAEASIRRSVEQAEGNQEAPQASPQVSAEDIADRVYRMIVRDLVLERERQR